MTARLSRRDGLRLIGLAALGASASPATVMAAADGLVHAEDFSDARTLDTGFWTLETGFFRNQEEQYYDPANVFVRDGALVLEGRVELKRNAAYDPAGPDWTRTRQYARYSSGSILSRRAFLYGVFEVVARVPAGLGTWPAIWLIDERGDPYREIDIMEAVGVTPDTVFSSVHAGTSLADLRHWSGQAAMPRLAEGFHTYRLDWRRDAVTIAVDGRTVLAMDPEAARVGGADPLRRPMQLRINLALGGSWGGRIDDAALPARLEIRSVRVWAPAA